jgi:hypothetical protein
MRVVEYLQRRGLRARLDGKGGFLLGGLQSLDPDERRNMTEFARCNKPRIVAELERQAAPVEARTGQSPQTARSTTINAASKDRQATGGAHGGNFTTGAFRGESYFPSEFSDPLFRLAEADGLFHAGGGFGFLYRHVTGNGEE